MTAKRTLGLAVLVAAAVAARRRGGVPEEVRIVDPEGRPLIDPDGSARSVQAAELPITPAALGVLWSPTGLERLARTYWRFLPRMSLGLIGVRYTPTERVIVLIGRPLVLLSFDPPEYDLTAEHASVRWRIRGGLLLARGGRPSRGSLQIGVRRLPESDEIHVEVAVADFAPSIAAVFGRRIYSATQSRIHVVVTHAFLRSLARLDLARAPAEHDTGG
ncbi:MAG: hypothetical protein ACR2KV_07460 [Solirubrobacteraceae bacterium]